MVAEAFDQVGLRFLQKSLDTQIELGDFLLLQYLQLRQPIVPHQN